MTKRRERIIKLLKKNAINAILVTLRWITEFYEIKRVLGKDKKNRTRVLENQTKPLSALVKYS